MARPKRVVDDPALKTFDDAFELSKVPFEPIVEAPVEAVEPIVGTKTTLQDMRDAIQDRFPKAEVHTYPDALVADLYRQHFGE